MPFIKQETRKAVDSDIRLADAPGDVCYALYQSLMSQWREKRRWTTAHQLYKNLVLDPYWAIEMFKDTKWTRPDIVSALHLAWQVFFIKEVMLYEEEKIEENGDIE